MNSIYPFLLSLFIVCQASGQESLPLHPDALKKDFDILEKSLWTLHPGLYRYQDSLSMAKHFAESREHFIKSHTLQEAFLHLAAFTQGIQCGHTYPNYWNQSKATQKALFQQSNKLPLTFVMLRDVFLVEKNIAEAIIPKGSRIVAINHIPTKEIIQKLLQYSRADGNNHGKRYVNFSLDGYGKFEAFDIFFPMLYPPVHGQYLLRFMDPSGQKHEVTVKTVSREERLAKMEKKYGTQPKTKDDLWKHRTLNANTAYLKLGTFAVWNMKMDWKAYLRTFFTTQKAQKTQNLILDLRGNEGGLMEVYWELFTYLTNKPLDLPRDKQLVRYTTVPDTLRPHLSSWNEGLFDVGALMKKYNKRFYTFKDTSINVLHVNPSPQAFTGKLVVLMDAANSSATFYLSKFIKENQLGVLVGQTSGGNLKGTNGGQMFMLKLPNSGLEVDIPLIGYFPRTPQEDAGLKPDYEIVRTVDYYTSEEDPDLQKALELLK